MLPNLLDDVFISENRDEDEPDLRDHVPVEIEIGIDYVEHSALLLPLRDAVVEAVLRKRSQSFHITRGSGEAQRSAETCS